MAVRVTTLLTAESLPQHTIVDTGSHQYCSSCNGAVQESRTGGEPFCYNCQQLMTGICTTHVGDGSDESLLNYGRELLRQFPTLTFIGLAETSQGRYQLRRKCRLTLTSGPAPHTSRYGGSTEAKGWLRQVWFRLIHGSGRN